MDITVIGTGYVGLIQGVCLADVGHSVVCVDIDADKVARLQAGISPIYEPGLDELLASGIASGRLRFSTSANGLAPLLGDVVFVAVGTPSSPSGSADLSAVRAAVRQIAEAADHDLVLAMKSTVPPGTGRALMHRFLEPADPRLGYVSNPEFLREGRAVEDWYHTDRLVLGSDDGAAATTVASLYDSLGAQVIVTDVASAETIKYASNAFLATKISFINEIANVCDCVDADIDAVSRGLGLDARIGPQFLNAGIGYGGSCFPKDVRALDFISAVNGYSFELAKAVIEVNTRQRLLPIMALSRRLGSLAGRGVAVLGLTFKPNTDDVRESPALDIVPLLIEEGAIVTVYDPLAADADLGEAVRTKDVWSALQGASAVVLVTEWPEFAELDWSRAAGLMAEPRLVFDGRNALDPASLAAAGLEYMAVGRPGTHRDHL
jgi:UDPglucose 6-dehydrogenase